MHLIALSNRPHIAGLDCISLVSIVKAFGRLKTDLSYPTVRSTELNRVSSNPPRHFPISNECRLIYVWPCRVIVSLRLFHHALVRCVKLYKPTYQLAQAQCCSVFLFPKPP